MPERFHSFVKTEIPYVNYVRDRLLAEVHVLPHERQDGERGHGIHHHAHRTEEIRRHQRHPRVRDGGVGNGRRDAKRPRQACSNAASCATSRRRPPPTASRLAYTARTEAAKAKDRWDFWVFSVSSNGYINAERSWNSSWINSSLSADRVTPELKIGLSVGTNYNESNFDVGSGSDAQTITSITHSEWFSGFAAWSLGEHWSIGGSADLYASTYENIDILASIRAGDRIRRLPLFRMHPAAAADRLLALLPASADTPRKRYTTDGARTWRARSSRRRTK